MAPNIMRQLATASKTKTCRCTDTLLFSSGTAAFLCILMMFAFTSAAEACEPKPALYLTPYITANETERGRQLARVSAVPGDTRNLSSYAGFITVNETDSSNTFFWLLETTNLTLKNRNDAPLLIYLDGGPGTPSFNALFLQNGPFSVDADANLVNKNFSWTDLGDVMYIDNPVGTGFSFTGSDDGYSRNEVQTGWNLYNFFVQFYQLFPTYVKRPLYLTGESYAGKYVPALAYRIHEQNKLTDQTLKVPLAGVMISGCWSDPVNQYGMYGPLLYNLGMIDLKGLTLVNNFTADVLRLIRNGQLDAAYTLNRDFMSDLATEQNHTLFFKLTGSKNSMNALKSVLSPTDAYYERYLARCDVRDALHMGDVPYSPDYEKVEHYLRTDFFDTVRSWLPTVYENYRTLIYTGQFDIIVGVPLVEQFLSVLDGWRDRDEFVDAIQLPWKVRADDAELAGYVKNIRNQFYYGVVRGTGHLVSYDQPERAFDLLSRFIRNETFAS